MISWEIIPARRELKWIFGIFTTIIIKKGRNTWPVITKHLMWLVTLPGQPGKLGTHQPEEMILVFSLWIWRRDGWQLGKFLKKGKKGKYDDHLQEHRRMTRYSKEDFKLSSAGTDKTAHRTNEYLGRSWEWREWTVQGAGTESHSGNKTSGKYKGNRKTLCTVKNIIWILKGRMETVKPFAPSLNSARTESMRGTTKAYKAHKKHFYPVLILEFIQLWIKGYQCNFTVFCSLNPCDQPCKAFLDLLHSLALSCCRMEMPCPNALCSVTASALPKLKASLCHWWKWKSDWIGYWMRRAICTWAIKINLLFQLGLRLLSKPRPCMASQSLAPHKINDRSFLWSLIKQAKGQNGPVTCTNHFSKVHSKESPWH